MNRVPDGASGNEPACKCRRHRDAGSVPGGDAASYPLKEGMAKSTDKTK